MMIKKQYILGAFLLVLILPYLALSFFTFPQGDDYALLISQQDLGIINAIKYMYLNWSGRYIAIIMGSFNPGINLLLYRISLVLFQLFFIVSLFFLIRSLINIKSKLIVFNISLIIFLVFVNIIPFLFEFLYWYPSVTSYQFGLSWFMLLLALSINYYNGKVSDVLFFPLASLLSFIIIGSNELLIIPFLLFVMNFLKSLKKNAAFYTFIIFISISIIITVFANGNFVRLPKLDTSLDIVNGLLTTIKTEFFIIGIFIQNPVFVIFSIVLIAFCGQCFNLNNIAIKVPFINPFKLMIISSSLLFVIILPASLILNHLPPGRIINLYSFFFFIIWVANIFVFTNYYKASLRYSMSKTHVLLVSLLAIWFLFNGIFVTDRHEFGFGDKKKAIFIYGNELNVCYTLLFESSKFKEEMQNRNKLLEKAKYERKKTISVPSLELHPKLVLFGVFYDKQKEGGWYKDSKTLYYNLDSIYIEPNKTKTP